MLKLINEDQTKVTPIPNTEQNQQVEDTPETDEETIKMAFEETINLLIQKSWDFIADAKSVIATLAVNYEDELKDDIIEILNIVVDDATINIGVLQKVANMMNKRRLQLLNTGEDRVEQILSEPDLAEALIKPKKDETEQEFVSRFVSNERTIKEFPNQKQRLAVAYNIFNNR